MLFQITGTNFGLSAGATVAIQIGNTEDGTLSQLLPAQPVFPPGDNGTPRIRPNETVRFTLPPGVGVNRAVRVVVYPSVFTSLAVSSSPLVDGASALFSYITPNITSVVSTILDGSATDISNARALLGQVRCDVLLS